MAYIETVYTFGVEVARGGGGGGEGGGLSVW